MPQHDDERVQHGEVIQDLRNMFEQQKMERKPISML